VTGPTTSAPMPGPRRRFDLTGAQETLVIPLYARALDHRSRRSILHDAKADEIVRSLDYDFARLGTRRPGPILPARNRQLDEWIREFLAVHANAVVLHVGCGLDTRCLRVPAPPAALWCDVDLPEVIELRRTIFAEGPSYRMLPGSLTDPGWLTALPNDRPLLAVADGVFEYLEKGAVVGFLGALVDRFPHGAAIFDVMSSAVQRRANQRLGQRSSAVLRWAVDDPRQLDRLLPRLRRTATVRLLTSRYLPLTTRLLFSLGWPIPGIRNAIRLLRYEF
jgi:O-methyltransferase involved in polyketide biosynthesis